MRPGRLLAATPLVAAWLAGPGMAGSGLAETDLSDLTPTERAIFHNEIREVLLTVPEILPEGAPRPVPDAAAIYAEEIESDLARIEAHAGELFSPALPGFGPAQATSRIALFTAPDCPGCARSEADLRDLARTRDLRVTLIDMGKNRALAEALGLDMAPSYVFPDQMLRGHIPPIVLERYLSE